MNLTLDEIARYLRLGGRAPEGELRERTETLSARAPLAPKALRLRDGNRLYLAGTIGVAFDAWQRRLAALSAADALIAQAIGTAAIERVMDDEEAAARAALAPGERLRPRRSPGYGDWPLELSREILARLDATRRIGVSLTESLLLVPSKSVTAICEIEREEVRG